MKVVFAYGGVDVRFCEHLALVIKLRPIVRLQPNHEILPSFDPCSYTVYAVIESLNRLFVVVMMMMMVMVLFLLH